MDVRAELPGRGAALPRVGPGRGGVGGPGGRGQEPVDLRRGVRGQRGGGRLLQAGLRPGGVDPGAVPAQPEGLRRVGHDPERTVARHRRQGVSYMGGGLLFTTF